MKNELGIEICCENCYLKYDCNLPVENACRINGQHLSFMPSIDASSNRIKQLQKLMREEADAIDLGVSALNTYYEARIKKIQEQQFTKAELSTIIDALQMAKEEFAFCPEEKAFDEILKKTERIINER